MKHVASKTYLQNLIHFRGAQHEAVRTCEVTRTMSDADCTNHFALATRKLKDEFALVVVLGFEDGQWFTGESATPVGKSGPW